MTRDDVIRMAREACPMTHDSVWNDDEVVAMLERFASVVARHEANKLDKEFDYKHPRAQALIGADARNRIVIDLVWQILEDPRREFTASDMEYWDKLHDKAQEIALAATAKR